MTLGAYDFWRVLSEAAPVLCLAAALWFVPLVGDQW